MADAYPAFSNLLKSRRDSLNTRFTQRIRSGIRIDGEAFLVHLRDRVAPLVESVHAGWPERAPAVLDALYDASLDLFAASLLGPGARIRGLDRVWTEILATNIKLLAREPVGITGSLCNGAFQVAQQCGERLELWLHRMREALPNCDSLGRVLEVGQVAAWRVGMVQYRQAAFEAAGRLPASLAAQALGLPDTPPDNLAAALDRLRQNPWLSVEAALQPSPLPPRLASVGTAGAFTGLGGAFPRPPVVAYDGGRLLVSAGQLRWQCLADAYGTWFRRIPEEKAAALPLPAGVMVDRRGNLKWGTLALPAPHLAGATSMACDGVTLAVTISTSHHLFLFARVGGLE